MRSHVTTLVLLVLFFFGTTHEVGREPASVPHPETYKWGHGKFCYRHAGPRAMIMRVEDEKCGPSYYRLERNRCNLYAGSGRLRAQVPAHSCK